VVSAGGTPVLLPPVGHWEPGHLSRMDGLIIAGGADIDPSCYGASRSPATGPARSDRDGSERTLVELAIRMGVPLLGVCRGMQMLNVVLGGTLHQHLPDEVGNTDHLPVPGTFGRVPVKVAPGSRFAGIVGEQVEVHCHHHQSVDRLGEGLVPVAWAGDGTVESVELPGETFFVGVQWHPEEDGGAGAQERSPSGLRHGRSASSAPRSARRRASAEHATREDGDLADERERPSYGVDQRLFAALVGEARR
jgi:putative glutamine amidotransferase